VIVCSNCLPVPC